MRVGLIIPLVVLTGCAHVQAPPAKPKAVIPADRCQLVQSPRDLQRARIEEQKAYLAYAKEIDQTIIGIRTDSAKAFKERESRKPALSAEERLQCEGSVTGVLVGLANERDRLTKLAQTLPGLDKPFDAFPDAPVTHPHLDRLWEECHSVVNRAEAERSQTNYVIGLERGELRNVIDRCQLPVVMGAPKNS